MIALRLPAVPRVWAAVLLLPLGVVMAGFVWFLHVASAPVALPPHADGIVVLTGGAERVETALHLLAEGRADRLLISGANRSAEFSELARRAHIDPALSDRVTVGHEASDTRGNAAETASWARAKGVRSLIVVTAGYHMPRALAELARALPDVETYPYRVVAPLVRELPDVASLRLLAREYAKYLIVRAGLS
ncbi:MAG TPA: YdcF family protein [Acetobacteraceae bacterium]|nr:YdcF family protein [Acetobacteraceae bacterium]